MIDWVISVFDDWFWIVVLWCFGWGLGCLFVTFVWIGLVVICFCGFCCLLIFCLFWVFVDWLLLLLFNSTLITFALYYYYGLCCLAWFVLLWVKVVAIAVNLMCAGLLWFGVDLEDLLFGVRLVVLWFCWIGVGFTFDLFCLDDCLLLLYVVIWFVCGFDLCVLVDLGCYGLRVLR